jgi:hypothetical protein
LDLLSAMYGASGEWNRYFFDCDPHWSPLGSAVAAQATRVGLTGFFYPPAANPVAPTGGR